MHSPISTGVSFGILFAVVGASFAYVGSNPFHLAPDVGVSVSRVTPRIADALGLAEVKGLLITDVEQGSPADRAGLQPVKIEERNGQQVAVSWDVITAIDGKAVNDEVDVQLILASKQVGDSARFTIIRINTTINVNVVLQ